MSRYPMHQYSRASQVSSSEQQPSSSSSPNLSTRTSPAFQLKDAFDDSLFAEYYDALFSGIIQNTDPPPSSPTFPKQTSSPTSSSSTAIAKHANTSVGATATGTTSSPLSQTSQKTCSNTLLPQKKVDQILGSYELGLDVNFYASKLNAFIGQAITRNIYILDACTGTGRVLADILTLLSSSRIKQRLYFVGTDCHETMLSKARLKIHRLLRSGAASGVDSISVNFVDADFETIERSVSPRRFHLIIVALACFHRITTHQTRIHFLTSICNLLLPDGRCIINLLPDKDILISKHQINISLDESLGSESTSSTRRESQRLMHSRSDVGRFRSSWRADMRRPTEITYFHLSYTNIEIDQCTDEELDESEKDPPEKLMSSTFRLQMIKETESPTGTGNDRPLQSNCTMNLRTVNVGRLIGLIEKAELEVLEAFDSFRGALCRQRSVNVQMAKVIVIGRKQQLHTMRSLRTIR